jgi:hypothetical protein
MFWGKHFTSENLGVSVLGHAAVIIALVIFADFVLTGASRIIAPDRIQITMIDLSQVKVSGNETILQNTDAPEKQAEKSTEPAPKAAPPAPAPESQEKIDAPSVLDDATKQEPESTKKPEKRPDDTPAPKKKTVVRVNRNVMSLDRTMTVSVVDALRVAMTRCWTVDSSRPDIADIRAVAHLTMRKNGTVSDVWFESAARAESDPGFAYVLETIRNAINVCQPLRMLPPNEYDSWKKVQLTFYPTTGAVM